MRSDLTEAEIRSLERWMASDALAAPPQVRDYVARLIGEVRTLRDREASTAFMAGLEGEY